MLAWRSCWTKSWHADDLERHDTQAKSCSYRIPGCPRHIAWFLSECHLASCHRLICSKTNYQLLYHVAYIKCEIAEMLSTMICRSKLYHKTRMGASDNLARGLKEMSSCCSRHFQMQLLEWKPLYFAFKFHRSFWPDKMTSCYSRWTLFVNNLLGQILRYETSLWMIAYINFYHFYWHDGYR